MRMAWAYRSAGKKSKGFVKTLFLLILFYRFCFSFPSHNMTFCGHALFSGKSFVASIFDKKGVSQECDVVRLVFLLFSLNKKPEHPLIMPH